MPKYYSNIGMLSAVALAPVNESKLYQARKPKIAEGKTQRRDEASTHKLEKA